MGWYLMVKTARPTGLKYLCKCMDNKDHIKYSGSGVLWKRHLKKYNISVWDTEVLGHYSTNAELREAGEYYSTYWNITESHEWANCIPEIGDGGSTTKGRKRYHHRETGEERMFFAQDATEEWIVGKNPENIRKKTPEEIEKCRLFHVGRKRSEEARVNMRNSTRPPKKSIECSVCGSSVTAMNLKRHEERCLGPSFDPELVADWFELEDFPGIFVCKEGMIKTVDGGSVPRCKSINRNTETIMCGLRDKTNKFKMVRQHILIAKMFVPNEKNIETVQFKDGDVFNMHANNLVWAYPNSGREFDINNNKSCKISQEDKLIMVKLFDEGIKSSIIAKHFNVSDSLICLYKKQYESNKNQENC